MDKKKISILVFVILLVSLAFFVVAELKKNDPVDSSRYRTFIEGTEKEILEYYYMNTTCTYYPGNGTYTPCKKIVNSTVTNLGYDNDLKRLKYGSVYSITTYETAK